MTFTAVVTSHARPDQLRRLLGNLRYQTRPPDETIVLCSDTPDVMRLREDFPDVKFVERDNLNDWGHAKRAEGLWLANMDWVGFFNDDDSYDLGYVEKMLAATAEADVVYCGWSTYPQCAFRLGSSTSGNFIVRGLVGRAVGWISRRYEADGDFIDALAAATDRIVYVPQVLYTHNRQP